jgi:hypothetical protein
MKGTMKKRQLQDVTTPNLYEDIFPYDQIPKIIFDGTIYEEIDGKKVVFDPGTITERDIWISDTTFRDGQQSLPPYTVEQIVRAYDYLAKISGPNGVIRQSEFFLYSEKDREAVRACQEQNHRYPEITAWIRADEGDFRLVKQMELKETGVLTSCSITTSLPSCALTAKRHLTSTSDLSSKGLTPAYECGATWKT